MTNLSNLDLATGTMLYDLPPELLLDIVGYLGSKSHWHLAATCTRLWARLSYLAKLRSQHAVYTIQPLESPNDYPPWQDVRPFIETIVVKEQADPFGEPQELFWVDKNTYQDSRGIDWPNHKPKETKKPHKFPNLRAIHIHASCIPWIHMIEMSAKILHMDSPFDTISILTFRGQSFGFFELKLIFYLPSLKHLRIEGPEIQWDDGSENSGSFEPTSSRIETLQLANSRISVSSACRLVAACKALKAFAYWQLEASSPENSLIQCIWDSSLIIHTLAEYQSESLEVLSLFSESVDRQTLPSLSFGRLAHLESLTCTWDSIMPGSISSWSIKELDKSPSKQLSEILPSNLKALCLEGNPSARYDRTPYGTQVSALKTYLEYLHCPLDRIHLPYWDEEIVEAANNQDIRYEVARINDDGVSFRDRRPFAHPDFEGDWTARYDEQVRLKYETFSEHANPVKPVDTANPGDPPADMANYSLKKVRNVFWLEDIST